MLNYFPIMHQAEKEPFFASKPHEEVIFVKTGVSTACFYPMLTELSLISLLEMGVTDLEIFFNTSSELDKKFIRGMRHSLKKYGGKVHSIHPYSSMMEPFMFFSNYERRFNDMIDDYKRYFEAANMLNADIIVIHGDRLPAHSPDEKYFERFNMIIECGKKEGVTVAQENVNLHRSQNPDFLRRMREWIGEDCKFVYDIKQAVRASYDPYYFAEQLGSDIKHIHVNDNNPSSTCLLPGKGLMDYAKLRDIICGNGCDPAWIIEVYRSNFGDGEELRDALKLLTKVVTSK